MNIYIKIKTIADGEKATGILLYNPILFWYTKKEEFNVAQKHPNYKIMKKINKSNN